LSGHLSNRFEFDDCTGDRSGPFCDTLRHLRRIAGSREVGDEYLDFGVRFRRHRQRWKAKEQHCQQSGHHCPKN